MIISGEIIEAGDLEGEAGARGVVLHRPDGSFITIKGLTVEEVRALAPLLYKPVVVKLEAPP